MTDTTFDPYGVGVMPPMRWSEAFYETRRWAWFNIGAFMLGRDTGRMNEPTRRGLEHASGLLPVDHPQLWSPADLVNRATWQHEQDAARVEYGRLAVQS